MGGEGVLDEEFVDIKDFRIKFPMTARTALKYLG